MYRDTKTKLGQILCFPNSGGMKGIGRCDVFALIKMPGDIFLPLFMIAGPGLQHPVRTDQARQSLSAACLCQTMIMRQP